MILTKLGIAASILAAVVALTAATRTLIPPAPAARPQAAQATDQPRPASSTLVVDAGNIRALLALGLVPDGLKWTDVLPEQRLPALDFIAARVKANVERIHTWRGTYAYRNGQLLSESVVRNAFAGRLPNQNLGALMQEFEGRIGFAIDMASGNVYRDNRYNAMTFVKAGTKDIVEIRGVGVVDTRSIVTKDQYVYFWPDQRATYSYLQHFPEARDKRMARRADRRQMSGHYGDMMDPAPSSRSIPATRPG
jgi:hypothetical protein